MALIGTLRDKMGAWVVIFVFLAISAFILTDLFSNNSVLFQDDEVGEIAGNSISQKEYQNAIDERVNQYLLYNNRKPSDREMITLRQEAWELLVVRHAFEREYEKLGVEVTISEVEDMLYGNNISPALLQDPTFQDPNTGQFDRSSLRRYLNDLREPPAGMDPEFLQQWQNARVRWEIFQSQLVPSRQRLKYENLVLLANYATTAEAERQYHQQTDVAEVRYLYVPYYTISDTTAQVSDAAVKDYYNKNRDRFKAEVSRSAKYVMFELLPSAADTAEVLNDMQRIAAELKETSDDSAYAETHSDGTMPFDYYHKGNLPSFVSEDQLEVGTVAGPVLDGSTYKVFKVSSITEDTVYSARASHILIRWDDETDASKREAREKARGILREIKAGADFAAKAREHGTDGTASSGGDLGWFIEGMMVKPFNDAIFNTNKAGLLNDVVETEFGYHIIEITEPKDNTRYGIAVIERDIFASDETINATNFAAQSFALDLDGEEEFVERAQEQGLTVRLAENVKPADRRLGTLSDARPAVQWLFRDADKGDVSEVINMQDIYVVAVMTGEVKDGYRPLSEVREEILPQVRKDAKAEIIVKKLKETSGTLDEIAAAYGTDAGVYSSSDLRMSTNTLPSAGFDPKAVGMAFSLEDGERSAPFAGESGVLIIEMVHKTIAPAAADYSTYKASLEQTARSRATANIAQAVKDAADITDERYKFY